ncbi:MAG TPA: TetR/AcrR family transcriptional regulator [Candidatus Limnocylindrales bacterium]|nr:TetR/AcrR family transcriptional regulator [Candidatus Limnocylindrales bacterium]
MPRTRRIDTLRPRKQPLQSRSRDTVTAILKAAAQVFTSRGYAGTTTNHIAERAGVSIGSLYEYFPNKDALLVALMEEHIRQGEVILARVALEAPSGPGHVREMISRFVTAMVDLHARDRQLHRVLFEEAPLPRRVRRQLAEVEERITARVADYLRMHPAVTRRDPALAAAVVVQTVEGLTHRLVVHGEGPARSQAYVEEIVTLVTAYLNASA